MSTKPETKYTPQQRDRLIQEYTGLLNRMDDRTLARSVFDGISNALSALRDSDKRNTVI